MLSVTVPLVPAPRRDHAARRRNWFAELLPEGDQYDYLLAEPAAGPVTLAPAYDSVPQAHLSSDGRLALAVNGKYRHAEITRDGLGAEFVRWGLRRPALTVDELYAAVKQRSPLYGAFPSLREQILGFVGNLRLGRAADA